MTDRLSDRDLDKLRRAAERKLKEAQPTAVVSIDADQLIALVAQARKKPRRIVAGKWQSADKN